MDCIELTRIVRMRREARAFHTHYWALRTSAFAVRWRESAAEDLKETQYRWQTLCAPRRRCWICTLPFILTYGTLATTAMYDGFIADPGLEAGAGRLEVV
jgi:hypothetical protein